MNKKYDAVVIGAGNGGLVCACKLALEGKRTLLAEKHNLPGGSATSFVRGRFEFEASLHELCGISPYAEGGSLKAVFDELGVSDQMDWIALNEAFRTITLNDEHNIDYTLPVGREAFIDRVEEYCPGSRQISTKIFDLIEEIDAAISYLGSIENFSTDIIRDMFGKYGNFINTASYSVNEVFDTLNVPKTVRDCFGGYWLYLGTNLDEMSFIHYATMFSSYVIGGPVIPKDRSHKISSALLNRFEELGGEVWFSTEAKRIIVKDNRVCGVEFDTGETVDCGYVVSNSSPYNLYTKLIDPMYVPKYQTKKLNSLRLAPKGFSLFLGLDASPEELGILNHSYFIYDTADTVLQAELTRNRRTNSMQAAVCLNNGNPGCSPEGTTILYITSIFTGNEAWSGVTEKDYVRAKREFADKVIENFEKATGTEIRSHIEEIEIASPMTYARYLNAPNGTIYGFENTGSYGIVQRIMTDAIGDKIEHLYYAGGYGKQSLGYNPSYASGYEAASNVISSMKKEAEGK